MTRNRSGGALRGAPSLFERVRLVFVFSLFLLNSLLLCLPFFPLILFKALLPFPRGRVACTRLMRRLGAGWMGGAKGILRLLPTEWDVEAPGGFSPRSWYLLLVNHQSWVDILVLVRTFGNRLPFPVFFAKKELRRFPLIGQAMWGLDYPFIERYPREVLERRPELRGRDRETVRRACEKAKSLPTTLIVFPEGTRFTRGKHRHQGSPFRRLLRPRPGGAGTVLKVLGERLGGVLDVTIVYPDGPPSLADLLAGRVPKVALRARLLDVPPDLAEDSSTSVDGRRRFQEWLDGLWREKDALLASFAPSEKGLPR